MENKTTKNTVKTKKVAIVYVPGDPLNPSEKAVQVTHNGRGWTVKRDVSVEVPIEVADILKDSRWITSYSVIEKVISE